MMVSFTGFLSQCKGLGEGWDDTGRRHFGTGETESVPWVGGERLTGLGHLCQIQGPFLGQCRATGGCDLFGAVPL